MTGTEILRERVELGRRRVALRERLAVLTAQHSLLAYASRLYPPFQNARHHSAIIAKLEAVERGEIKRAMFFMPPRHGKTLTTSEIFPAWFLGRDPSRLIMAATHGQELADATGRKVRNILADERHTEIFPDCQLSKDSMAAHRFNTTAGGQYIGAGRGGSFTGRGADLLLIDDPLKDRDEANSPTIRAGLHEWYASTAYSRLHPGAAVIIISTRWHEDDLCGWLLREHAHENWDVLSLPAIAEADGVDWRKEGEALWPERFDEEALRRIRITSGANWASLYQQRPAAIEGAVFRREWWKYFTAAPEFKRIVQFWDTAFKSGAENDFSVCTTWGETATAYFLLDVWRERIEFPELKRTAIALYDKWKAHAVLVEDKASGQSLVQELQRETKLPVVPWKVDKDKVARATAVTPLVEAGRVFLPERAPWLLAYLDELSSFPTAPHDDQVDSTTGALAYLTQGGNGWSLYFAEELAAAAAKEATEQENANAA